MINPVHIGERQVRLDLVDDEYNDLACNDRRFMKCYLVAVGWESTLVSRDGMRPFQGNPDTYRGDPRYDGFVRNRRRELREQLERIGDEVIDWITVYAHERRHVTKLYEVGNAAA